ncbi:hypothetical protein [Yersinia entomophaga]|nr:hypothetical protein [Yersinia entomophaga]
MALCAFMVTAGRYARYRILYLGMPLFGLSLPSAGLADSIWMMNLFRLLQ